MLESVLESRRNRKKKKKKRELKKEKESPKWTRKRKRRVDRDRSGICVWWRKNQEKKNVWKKPYEIKEGKII